MEVTPLTGQFLVAVLQHLSCYQEPKLTTVAPLVEGKISTKARSQLLNLSNPETR